MPNRGGAACGTGDALGGGLLLLLLVSASLSAADATAGILPSQEDVPLEHVSPPDGRPTEPIRLFNPRLPFKLGPIDNKDEISLDLHEGNAWNPTVVLEYPGFRQPASTALEHPVPISQAPPGTKIYAA